MRVFVTDGENRAALAVTRSLGRAGHEVIVGEKQTPALAQTSRYCTGWVRYADPVVASDEFLDGLARTVHDRQVDVLLPIADITTFLITRNRHRFGPACSIPFAEAGTVERAANKVAMVETAVRLGVPVPRSMVVPSADALPGDAELEFPLVIKPWRSRIHTSAGWVGSSVSYAADRRALELDLALRPPHEFPVMLQECIVGPGTGVFACYRDGKPVALFSHRRVRERPPWGGVSVLSESVAMCPQARAYAVALLDDLHWHGVAMVEFKRDVRDGLPKLMEINGRFWGSLQLAVDAGVDFPTLLVGSGNGGGAAAPDVAAPLVDYRVGVRSRWLWGDLDSLLLTLFAGRPTPGGTSRLRAVLEFMQCLNRNLYYDNPKPGDVGPWLHETRGRVKSALRRLTRTRQPAGDGVAQTSHAGKSRRPTPDTRRPGVSVCYSLDEVGLDDRAWNDLAAESEFHSIFQTYQWTRSWWGTFGEPYEPFFVTVRDGSGVSGVVPLYVEQGLSRERILRFVGDGRADYCDVLAAGDKTPVLTAMFALLRRSTAWDVLELNNIPEHSGTVQILEQLSAGAGYHVISEDQFVCPTLLVEGNEDEVRAIRDKASLRRRQNAFEREGRLVCRNIADPVHVSLCLEEFFAQHVARWSGTASPSLFTNLRNRTFYRNLTSSLSGTEWLLFSVVEFNDRPIAFHYGFDYNGSVIWYKPSFDPAFASRSPGLVLVRHLIGYTLEQQRRELDFTVGDEAFKARFTNSTRRTLRIQIFREPARFMLEYSRRKLVSAMKTLAPGTRNWRTAR